MPLDDPVRQSLGSRTIDRADASLHTIGRAGDEPMVVFVHGLAGRGREWLPVVEALDPDVAVCLPDLRGHGASTRRPPISATALVDDLVAVIGAWTDSPVVVVGQSLGGVVATMVAARHPDRVRGLVLVESGMAEDSAEDRDEVDRLLAAWPRPFPTLAAGRDYFGSGPVGQAWTEMLDRRPDGWWPAFDVDVAREVLACLTERPRWDEWRSLAVPTTVIRGGRGDIPDAEAARMQRLRPTTTTVVVDDVGHDVHLAAPIDVADRINDLRMTAR